VKMRLLIAGAVAIGSLGLAACGDDDDDGGKADDNGGGGAPSGDTVDYDITGIQYTDLSAPAGGTIKITNDSGVAHTFSADDESVFEDQIPADGSTDVKAPDEAGDYPFHCDIHPSMKATLTVTG
jgi:hypothetical protein